ncbi:MAG TPA: protein kinase [Chthoniobacteraceae bacterium]|nr:protein kinase [Chthoniobacteraceae bacterium]
MNTTAPNTCAKCGKPILEGSPRGLCPLCLISAVAKSDEPPLPESSAPELDDLRRVFPQLEILEPLGAGGMGRVYKTRQPHLDRLVALKVLPPAYANDPEWVERFTREARALARLNHPNIVQVYDFGETAPDENGKRFPFLIMEFVDGVNLRQALRTGALTAREALSIVPSICGALQYAHDQGVLHRDIKPENILLDTLGRVKIADFGLAKLRADGAPNLTLTATGARLGTTAYMAPEQIEKPRDVDHRADIYSLGVVFYELLTGELPLGRFAAPSEKAGTDPRLDTIVFRTLEKERERRFQTATAMQTEVETVANNPAPEAAALLPSETAPEPRHSLVVRVLLLLTVVCGIGIPASRVMGFAHPQTMVMLTILFGTLAAVWPGIFGELPAPAPVVTPPVAGKRGEFSRAALAGIILAAIGIPFIAGAFIVMGLVIPRAFAAHNDFGVRSSWFSSLPFVVGLFGLLPAIAATICGWKAINQIRASGGVLRGAGCAIFSALLYPSVLLLMLGPVVFGHFFSIAGTFVGLLLGALLTVWLWRLQSDRITDSGAHRPLLWPWALGLALLVTPPALIIGGLILPYSHLQRPRILSPSSGVLADVVTTKDAPFVARLPEGTVELLGVSYHPSKGERWWRMDGVPIVGEAYLNSGAHVAASPGQRGYEFVFRLNNLPPEATLVSWQIANSSGYATGNAPELASAPGKALPDHQAIAAALPATLRATDIRIGFGFGEWVTVFGSGQSGPGSTNPMHDGVRWQLGWSAPLETKNGETVTNWTVPRNPDWETRVVAVKSDDTEAATGNRSSANDQTTWRFTDLPLAQVKDFRFQVRRVQWIEFRGVALAPQSAAATRSADQRSIDALQDETIRLAHEQLDVARLQAANGLVSPLEVLKAERDLAIAEARGDAVKTAEAKIKYARIHASYARTALEVGTASPAELNEAERELNAAQIELEQSRATAR